MNGKFLNKWMSVLLCDSHWVPSFQTSKHYFMLFLLCIFLQSIY